MIMEGDAEIMGEALPERERCDYGRLRTYPRESGVTGLRGGLSAPDRRT
jgi:hypothetical protein